MAFALPTNAELLFRPPVLQQGLGFAFISCARTVSKDIVLWAQQVIGRVLPRNG